MTFKEKIVPHIFEPGVSRTKTVLAPALNLEWAAGAVRIALDEDLGGYPGIDVTSSATHTTGELVTAHLMAREAGVVAGLDLLPLVLEQVATRFEMPLAEVSFIAADGDRVSTGDKLATIVGPVQVLLIAERTALNLMSRASGVASATRLWADQLEGTGATVLDTRKTTPGLRELEKYAVRAGGGTNKRMGLYDVAMVKDNHVTAAGSISKAIAAVKAMHPEVVIQVEADTVDQALEAITAGARFLLLDNMSDPVMTKTVAAIRATEPQVGKVELEATGNLTLDRANSAAQTGVDYMSVGALTHSAPILDLALDLENLSV